MKKNLKIKIYICIVFFILLSVQAVFAGGAKIDVLDLKKMDVQDVLKLLSQKSGMNIVAGPHVKGFVSVYLEDIEVLEALKIITDAYGWAYVREDSLVKVMSEREYKKKYGYKFGHAVITSVRPLMFISTAELVPILEQVKSEDGKIIANEVSQTVILTDEPGNIEEMEKIISKVDVPIRTKVFEISYGKAESLGEKISHILTPTIGTMKFDERSNKIVVTDTFQKTPEG